MNNGGILYNTNESASQNNILNTKFSKSHYLMKKAEYIGSFLVTGGAHYERAEIVRQKLEAARAYTQSIKVCDDGGTSVHMAHALRRISYATCDPDFCQFAFLAREPRAQPSFQYCHAFVTKTPDEAESLNNTVGEAFRVAYAQQRALLDSRRGLTPQTQTGTETEPCEVPPAPVASNPVPELDSGLTTTTDASCFQNTDVGYTTDSGLSDARPVMIREPSCRSNGSPDGRHDSPPLSSPAMNEADSGGVEDEDDEGFANPPSVPHPTPLPHPRRSGDIDVAELADSLAALPDPLSRHRRRRRRPTPFSPSTMNTYDQPITTPESSKRTTFPSPSERCISFGSTGGTIGADGDSPSTSESATSCNQTTSGQPPPLYSLPSNQLFSAPWYQPNIPRDLALNVLMRQPPGSFVVRDSGTHANCYALSVRVASGGSAQPQDRCLSAGMSPRHSSVAAGGAISHYLIQRTPTGVRLKGLEKEWPSLPCLILHLTVMPEMLPCPLLDLPQSSSNPTAFLAAGGNHPHLEQAPDSLSFRPISVSVANQRSTTPPQQTPTSNTADYQQLSEFSSVLADLNSQNRRRRQPPPPPPPPHPPTRIS